MDTIAVRFATQLGYALGIAVAAMRANRAIGPMLRFLVFASLVRIATNGVAKARPRDVSCLGKNQAGTDLT